MLVHERQEARDGAPLEVLELGHEPMAEPASTWPADGDRAQGRPRRVLQAITRWLVLVIGGAALLAALLAALSSAVKLVDGTTSNTTPAVVLPPLDQSSVVYAADGSVAAVLHAGEDRKAVTLDQVSPVLIDAVVDTEDVRFWRHGPVDARAILRAANANASAGRIRQGGSTIAQQLAKNTLLTSKQDVERKVKEVVLAKRLLDQLGRRGVLERYLNTVYFGNGAYGVDAAARRYFGVGAGEVTAPQAALLAGVIRDPDGYDPLRNPDAAKARRATVLDLMVAQGHLPPAEAATARSVPLPTVAVQAPAVRDYFTDTVKEALLADPRLGGTPQERYQAVFAGGLRVYTTLDPGAQEAARQAVERGLPKAKMPLTAAVVAIDPANGEVRAIVGGPNYVTAGYNPAVEGAGRQPGSAFKPFTLIAALEQGYSPKDTISGSSPCVIPNPGGTPDPWRPSNYEGSSSGTTTLTDAMVRSVNCAYARLALMVGLGNITDVAHRMGITSALAEVPSMTLGTNVVTPLQMASAYATLAANGEYRKPHIIRSVEGPNGEEVFKEKVETRRAISPAVAAMATEVLTQVVRRGTGTGAAVPGHSVAGKTGTADEYQDAWFVGYGPELAAAVWMGNPDAEVPMRNVAGISVTGGSFPARIWRDFMTVVLPGDRRGLFPLPAASDIPKGKALRTGYTRDGKRIPGTAPEKRSGKSGSSSCTKPCSKPRR